MHLVRCSVGGMDDAVVAPAPAQVGTVVVGTAAELERYLEALNAAGTDPVVAGTDARGAAFLAQLAGPYGTSTVVLRGDPRDDEVDYGTGTRCTECWGANPFGATDVRYPATLLTPTPTAPVDTVGAYAATLQGMGVQAAVVAEFVDRARRAT